MAMVGFGWNKSSMASPEVVGFQSYIFNQGQGGGGFATEGSAPRARQCLETNLRYRVLEVPDFTGFF
jgi:hypothetical protein